MKSICPGDKAGVDRFGTPVAGIVFGNINIFGITDKPDGAALHMGIGIGGNDFFQQSHRFFGSTCFFQQYPADYTGAQTVLAVFGFGVSVAGVHHNYHTPVVDPLGGVK